VSVRYSAREMSFRRVSTGTKWFRPESAQTESANNSPNYSAFDRRTFIVFARTCPVLCRDRTELAEASRLPLA